MSENNQDKLREQQLINEYRHYYPELVPYQYRIMEEAERVAQEFYEQGKTADDRFIIDEAIARFESQHKLSQATTNDNVAGRQQKPGPDVGEQAIEKTPEEIWHTPDEEWADYRDEMIRKSNGY